MGSSSNQPGALLTVDESWGSGQWQRLETMLSDDQLGNIGRQTHVYLLRQEMFDVKLQGAKMPIPRAWPYRVR